MNARRTKIVATLGPSSDTSEKPARARRCGDGCRAAQPVARHARRARSSARAAIREVEDDAGRPIALIADLQGPKMRVGELAEPVVLRKGEAITVCAGGEVPRRRPAGRAGRDRRRARSRPRRPDRRRARAPPRRARSRTGARSCEVIVGGAVTSHKGVNLPGVPLPIPSLTRKDTEDLEFAMQLGVDFVALSFVRSPADVRDLRALIEQAGSHAHVIAKIEKAEAVDVLDDVLAETDAVMVARGDLGVEIGPALVPLIQKRIIQKALERGKPVITATQMLESMVHHPEPTRAEASDVANAILDGTSAVMLSGETAVGEYPVEAVAYMDRIARAVEPSMGYRHEIPAGRRRTRRSAARCRTQRATSPRRCARRRSSCRRIAGRRRRASRACARGGRSSR